jgi:hypothetical protein
VVWMSTLVVNHYYRLSNKMGNDAGAVRRELYLSTRLNLGTQAFRLSVQFASTIFWFFLLYHGSAKENIRLI